MSNEPKPPSDEELDALLTAMQVVSEVEDMTDPNEGGLPTPERPEVEGRAILLRKMHDLIQDVGKKARLTGFVFAGVCEDGITPVVYAIKSMNPITARLLIAEIQLLLSRITTNLNATEAYRPQDGEKDEPEQN